MCANVVNSFNAMFPSVTVGEAFARDVKIPKDARLTVMSNGYLKKRLLNYVKNGTCISMEFTDILMLDEVHMGVLDTHIIVSIWYYCATKFATTARMPRLLLSSATVSDALFSRRFPPCVVLPAELMTKTPYDIGVQYASRDYGIDEAARYADIGALLKSLHESKPISERILVFLPGRGEMTKTITASGLNTETDITLVTIWSESTVDDYKPIERATDHNRLVVFATPSADAGLTIKGLIHVIDSLLVKNSHVQPNGSEALISEIASKQLARQRRGRVGRTAPGYYYPMCTEEFFNGSSMPASYTLEIQRRPLYNDIVELVAHGIQVEEVFAIYNIPTLSVTIDQLLQWGLLRRSATSGELYPSTGGTFMTQTDVASPRLAGVLYAWVQIGRPVTSGVILTHLIAGFTAQILQIPNFETRPGEPRGKMERLRVDFIRKTYGRFLGPSDVSTAIRLWNTILNETSSTETVNLDAIMTWCNANSIQWRAVKNVIKSIQRTVPKIKREASRLAIRNATEPTPDVSNWIIDESIAVPIIRRLMEHVYQDQIASRSGDSRVVYVKRDGSTLKPAGRLGFTLQSDPDSATDFPMKVVIIGQRTTTVGDLVLTQFLDIDDPTKIAKISSEELNTKLGIFLNKTGVRRTR
jgi:hypothetical protein